jgi:hypothetical protein
MREQQKQKQQRLLQPVEVIRETFDKEFEDESGEMQMDDDQQQ